MLSFFKITKFRNFHLTKLLKYGIITTNRKGGKKKKKLKGVRMMNIDRYLVAYENYRDTVLGMKKAMSRVSTGGKLPVREMIEFVDYEELEREYERKKRILSHETKRLQKAISKISDTRLSNYLTCKYLYCMTNEEFAENFTYCERQVYRISSKARKELHKHMVPCIMKARRLKSKKRFRQTYPRKKTLRKYGLHPRSKLAYRNVDNSQTKHNGETGL